MTDDFHNLAAELRALLDCWASPLYGRPADARRP